jgi:hypothetical protein
MTVRSDAGGPDAGGPDAGGPVGGLRSGADVADLAAFCTRVRRLDPDGLIRLRQAGERLTAYSQLPMGVLVSRTVHAAAVRDADRTVGAGDLLALLEAEPAVPTAGNAPGDADLVQRVMVGQASARDRDADWRGTLPPSSGWRRLDVVPVTAIDAAVRAGLAAFDAVRGRPDASTVGESLLDHEALTVSDGRASVVLPLRVLHAAWRMGFLGTAERHAGSDCAVSSAGRWVRLAAPHGSAYHQASIGLAVR